MDDHNLIDFDPLCSKSAESYVESVMAPSAQEVTADVHHDTVSTNYINQNNKTNHKSIAGHKRTLAEHDVQNESAKKKKPNEQIETHKDEYKGSNRDSDIRELKSMVEGLTKSMNNMCISLTDRINRFEQNMSKELAVLIEKKIKHEISQVKQEINCSMSVFQEKVNSLEAKVNGFEKTYASAAKQSVSVNEDKKLNIVIKGVTTGKNETNNAQCTMNKVNSLIRDGLKLSNVKVIKAERKDSRNNKPGLIIAKLQSMDDKKAVMKAKSKLKGNRSYSEVYIENDIPADVRFQQNNLRTILREIGKSNKYKVVGSKILPIKESASSRR